MTRMEASRLSTSLSQLWAEPWMQTVAGLALLAAVAWLADIVARRLLLKLVRAATTRSANTFDDALLARGVFHWIAHLAPAAVVQLGVPLIPGLPPAAVTSLRNLAAAVMVALGGLALTRLLAAVNDLYQQRPIAKTRPLKGYVQLGQIAIWIVAAIVILGLLINRSPLLLLSGLGAMTAVLLLVFKDTVLSLVASVQIAANDMLRVGDWIEMASAGADGEVTDVALHAVTVQNWDKTIVRIPTWKLVAESFKNWRGMQEAGARRIKRALHLDVASVRFLDEAEVAEFGRFRLLADYIAGKCVSVAETNAALGREAELPANRRRLTNLGTYRAYANAYLRQHPGIHPGLTVMVRQLAPTPAGLPLELYCFTATTVWAEHEGIASDLFDHLYAMLPAFGLRAFQPPTGHDLREGVAALVAQRPGLMSPPPVD